MNAVSHPPQVLLIFNFRTTY